MVPLGLPFAEAPFLPLLPLLPLLLLLISFYIQHSEFHILDFGFLMPCSRDKKRKKPKKGGYVCKGCGQARRKKHKLCEPRKVKKRDLQETRPS